MNLQALVIGNPGEVGDQTYCEGVNRDLAFYPEFLRSAVGGAWKQTEITVLTRPDLQVVRSAIQNLTNAEYSLVIFAGHGHTDPLTHSTILTLKRGHELDSVELRRGAPKHTLVLDCCRVIERVALAEDQLRKALVAKAGLDPVECRKYYEMRLNNCAPALVVLHACHAGETAGDDFAAGGYYSSSLLIGTREWSNSSTFNTTANAYPYSVVDAHDKAALRVNGLSGGRQHAQIEKPRSGPYFPFGIVA